MALSAKQETTPGEIKANDVTSVDFSPLTEIRPRRPLQLKMKKKKDSVFIIFLWSNLLIETAIFMARWESLNLIRGLGTHPPCFHSQQ